MRIGIDISQAVYEGTGVGKYVRELIPRLIALAPQHDFVLFAGTLRQKKSIQKFVRAIQKRASNIEVKIVSLPPTFLDFLWNKLHIIPIQWLIGKVDVFWSSDWTQPPLGNAIGMTTIHDVSFLHFPESFHKKIVAVQRRRLLHALQECSVFLCDSEATKNDVEEYIGIKKNKLFVVYPGYSSTI
ncbi:MAG: glycosyltransferase [Candidatus Gottesmanbacteria bacterium]